MEFTITALIAAADAEDRPTADALYGEQAWRIQGAEVDVVFWDEYKGWASVMTVIPNDGEEATTANFWRRLFQIAPEGQLDTEDPDDDTLGPGEQDESSDFDEEDDFDLD